MKLATSLLLATATTALKLESQATQTIWALMTKFGTDKSSEGSVKPENVRSTIKEA